MPGRPGQGHLRPLSLLDPAAGPGRGGDRHLPGLAGALRGGGTAGREFRPRSGPRRLSAAAAARRRLRPADGAGVLTAGPDARPRSAARPALPRHAGEPGRRLAPAAPRGPGLGRSAADGRRHRGADRACLRLGRRPPLRWLVRGRGARHPHRLPPAGRGGSRGRAAPRPQPARHAAPGARRSRRPAGAHRQRHAGAGHRAHGAGRGGDGGGQSAPGARAGDAGARTLASISSTSSRIRSPPSTSWR